MKFDFGSLKGSDTEKVLDVLINHVTKTDEEAREEIEKGDRTTQLKVYIVENYGFELGGLEETIDDLLSSDKLGHNSRKFFREHKVKEQRLNDEVSYIEITTPQYDRTDQFIFLSGDDYLKVLTAERKSWAEKTVERLLDYIPELDRLYLSHSNLKNLVDSLDKTDISGFTAKYNSFYEDKKVSIRFHGGDEDDLKKVEREFGAKPTRIEFEQRNSPSAAITGSFNRHGNISFPKIRKGSEEKGKETFQNITDNYAELDRRDFEVTNKPTKRPLDVGGFTIDGYTSMELKLEENDYPFEEEDLAGNLVDGVLDKKRRYKFGRWDESTFFVFDKENSEHFEVGVEGQNLVVHTREGTTSVTIRDFCEIVIDEFNSTYDIEKTTKALRAKG